LIMAASFLWPDPLYGTVEVVDSLIR
jgi:hypothetical protein